MDLGDPLLRNGDARLILICGLPGAGKTTLAKHLAHERQAVRLSPDEWKHDLGIDYYDEAGRVRIEARLWLLAQELLGLGQTVIMENGFWAREERDELRLAARGLGWPVELHSLEVPVDELWQRLAGRNEQALPGTAPIRRDDLERWAERFEAPDAAELALFDAPADPPTAAGAEKVEVVVAHDERATLRVGDVFVKIDSDPARLDREVAAMALAPVPTPEVLWRKPAVLALAALPGTALGLLGEPSTASAAAWAAAGAAVRTLHDAPLPPWPGRTADELAARLQGECEWLVANDVVPSDVVTRNRRLAETALRPWTPVFIHGDLQIVHVLVDGDEVTGIVDWSEGAPGDALYDLASLTLAHEEHLDDVIAGYGTDVDRDLVRAWWALRCLLGVRWLTEAGYGPPEDHPEVAVLRSLA